MADPQAFCRRVMHEYEEQWSRTSGHAVRHPLRLKMEALQAWCEAGATPEAFEEQLKQAQESDEPGVALLACELLPRWEKARGRQV